MRKEIPEGGLIAFGFVLVLLLSVLALFATIPAQAQAAEAMQPGPGAMCTNLTARHTHKADKMTAESVRVLELAPLPSGAPGAWVMPVAGPLAWAQFHVALDSLTECQT